MPSRTPSSLAAALLVGASAALLAQGASLPFAPVQADLELMRQAAASFESAPADERQRRFEAMAAQIRGSARNIANRSNELGKSTASEMRALATAVSVASGQPGFACHDPTLAQRLRQAADQADEPAKLQLRQAVFSEGPAGVANAVKNLWTNMGAYIASLATYVASGGKRTGDYTASGEPITGRDMIALLATIGIDLGLFVLALLDRPNVASSGMNAPAARLHQPSPAVVRQLAAAFETAIARAPDASLEWVRQHFIHHAGASFFVIPNLYGINKSGPESKKEELRALALNQLAGVLEDVKLVRTVTAPELKTFLDEEARESHTDLSEVRKKWREKSKIKTTDQSPDVTPIRNHGLLSKAERTLDIAGWSAESKRDVELYRLVDTEGLTPLLSLLNDATLAKGADAAAAASTEAAALRSPPLAITDQRR